MGAAIDDAAAVHDDHLIGEGDGRQPVRDDEGRPAGHRLAQPRLDRGLGGRVDRGGRVVEDQDPRIGKQRPGDRDSLALAPRERQPALADHGVVARRQLADEAVGLGPASGELDLLAGRARAGIGDVVGDAGAEEEAVVGHERDLRAKRGDVDGAYVGAVHQHRALARVVQATQELHKVADRVRFVYGAEKLPGDTVLLLAASCRKAWGERTTLLEGCGRELGREVEQRLRTDLLAGETRFARMHAEWLATFAPADHENRPGQAG